MVAEMAIWGFVFVAAAGAWFYVRWVFKRRGRLLQSWRPNWYEAARRFPVPEGMSSWTWTWMWGGWAKCYVQDEPGSRLYRCAINPVEAGIVVRDAYLAGCIMLIPWSALRNPRNVKLPWYRFFLDESQIEVEVEGVPITIVGLVGAFRDVNLNTIRTGGDGHAGR